MNKRKSIVICSFILITISIFMGIGIINKSKVNKSMQVGIDFLKEGQYEKAKVELEKAILIDDSNEKCIELLALTDEYMKLEELYSYKEYLLVDEEIKKIRDNKYINYIEEKVREIDENNKKKIAIIKEVEEIDNKIKQLLTENKFKEALDLINKYLKEDLKEEYINKLNELINEVNKNKIEYEEEVAKQEELKRQEEERKKQEELAQQNQNKPQVTTPQTPPQTTEVNKNIGQIEAADIALKVVQQKHPGYGPHYFERGLVTEGEKRWAFIFLQLEDPNAASVNDSPIIGKVGYTVNAKTGEVKKEDWLVQW